jgi:arylesterase/paraoxonase
LASLGTTINPPQWATIVATIVSFLAERKQSVQLIYTNFPGKVPTESAFKSYSVDFKSKVRNCEDLALNEELGILYLSCDPGRDRWNTPMGVLDDANWREGAIWYLDYAANSNAEPELLPISNWKSNPRSAETLHPLGVALDVPNYLLYFTTLSKLKPGIEVLKLSDDGKSATWQKTLINDGMHTPNSILPLSKNELLFTNDHYFKPEQHLLAQAETYLALPYASVMHLDIVKNQTTQLASLPFANGIVKLNETHIAVASTIYPGMYIYELDLSVPATPSAKLTKRFPLNFWPDNLSVDANGKLLIAGHSFGLGVGTVAKAIGKYDIEGTGAEGLLDAKDVPTSGSWVAEWDGVTVRDLYKGEKEFQMTTTAVRDVKRNIGFICALYDKGILRWTE